MHWLAPNKRGGILGILAYLRCGQDPPTSHLLPPPPVTLVEVVLEKSRGDEGVVGLYYRILNGNDGPGSAGAMGKWSMCLAVARRRSGDSGSQNRVTLPQRIITGWGGVGGMREIGMPDPSNHFTPPPPPAPQPLNPSTPQPNLPPPHLPSQNPQAADRHSLPSGKQMEKSHRCRRHRQKHQPPNPVAMPTERPDSVEQP